MVGEGDGVAVGVTVPPGVGDPEGVVDGTAVFVGVGETRIAVKYAAEGIVHNRAPCADVKDIIIVTSLLIALAFITTGKTASPSEVVVTDMVSVVPSGHCIIAEAVASFTPSGLLIPSTVTVCVTLP